MQVKKKNITCQRRVQWKSLTGNFNSKLSYCLFFHSYHESVTSGYWIIVFYKRQNLHATKRWRIDSSVWRSLRVLSIGHTKSMFLSFKIHCQHRINRKLEFNSASKKYSYNTLIFSHWCINCVSCYIQEETTLCTCSFREIFWTKSSHGFSQLLGQQRKQVRSHVIIVMSISGCSACLVIMLILCLPLLTEERTCAQTHMLICKNDNQKIICTWKMSRWFETSSICLIIPASFVERYSLKNSSAVRQKSTVRFPTLLGQKLLPVAASAVSETVETESINLSSIYLTVVRIAYALLFV